MTDLSALKDFLILCQFKSFSRAAERCHVSVSGLSRRIQGLEDWLGASVFDRRRTALQLTPAGERLQAVASEVVYALEGLRRSVRAEGKDRESRIRFVAPHVLSAVFFADWIPRLHSDFRGAKFSVSSDNLPECFAMLCEGSADYLVALIDDGTAVMDQLGLHTNTVDFQTLALGRERLVPVCAPNAAGQPAHDLRGDRGEAVSFLGYAAECHLGWSLRALLAAHPDLHLEQRHEASLTDGLRVMALAGLGVAWLPYALISNDLQARRLVVAGGPALEVSLSFMLMRRRQPMAAQAESLWTHLEKLSSPERDRSARVGAPSGAQFG